MSTKKRAPASGPTTRSPRLAAAASPVAGHEISGNGRSFYDRSILTSPEEAVEFIGGLLQSSTEYSVIGKDLEGKILLWNEGARRIYGYEPREVVGKAHADMLHTAEDRAAGRPAQILAAAIRDGKWEGTLERVRKDGTHFTARVVITPRRAKDGTPIGYLLISKDISDEIALTDELRRTQFYTRSLIESNIDALMTTDPLGVITDVNEQMEALTGTARTDLIGSRFKTYFTDPDRAEEGIGLVLREGKVTNYELTARAKDGRETLVSYNAATFRDADGKLQGVFAGARDITAQKQLEGQIRESEAYNRGLIEASVDGLVTVDPSGVISDVNETMSRMSGYSREELIGSPFADYFVDADRAGAGVEETFQRGVVTDYVLTLATRDGRQLQVSFNASIFRAATGEVRGIFASARDITDQAHLQAQLAEERAYNRGLIEASVDGLVTVDPMLQITDVNETMCRMAGYAREELIGSPFPDYFTDRRRAAEGVRLTLDQGSVTNYELTLRTRDAEERLVSFNAAVFRDEQGAIRGIFASARDITESAGLGAQLAEERAYNRGLIEASVDGLVTVDESMTITDVNETMCRMAGRPRQQLIGSRFPGYFDDPDRAAEGVRLTYEQGSVTNYVLNLVAADGRSVPVSFNAAVFRDATGTVKGIFASARDIASQQELEEQLRAQQFYTRSLIESNIDALMTTDPLGIITDVNEPMAVLTGRRRDDLIGSPFKDHFTDPLRAEEGIRLTLREGKVTNYELTALAEDGRETVVSYNAATFYDRDGQLQGVFAGARDITAQKHLEGQLREQQTYLRGLIESSVDGLVTVDPEGTITDVNDRMCEMAGYARAELIGTPFADYFTDPEAARSGVDQTFHDGVVTEYALTLVSRTRRLLQVSFNASIFRDEQGEVRGIFASARDITDRVRLEEQLREQQTYLRGLIESSVDGLVTVDPEGFITDVNEQLCRMTGYAREELIGSPFKRYFTDPERADHGVRQTLADGVVTNYDLVLQSKGGRKATVSFNASIFRSADGRIEGIFASARDISDQARLQSQLSEQQAYNRSLIEASADALFAISPDGVVTDVNEEATRLSGYLRRHLVNSAFADYFTDPERARAGVRRTLDEGRVIGYELTLTTRAGRRITVSFNAGVFTDTAGQPLGILAAARDITAQKELEEQLRAQQFYTRSLIESNIDALMTTDPLGIITDVNEPMAVLTGRRRDDLIGSPFKDHFTDPLRAEEGIRLTLREGKVTNYELTARAKDGKETVVSYNASTFDDQEGKLQGVFAAARDITEQKALTERIRESEAYNRGLIEASVDGLVTVDPSGIVTDVNETMCRMTGYERPALIGSTFSEYFVDRARAEAGVRETFDNGFVTDYVLTLRTREGREAPVSFNASVFRDTTGNVRGIFASARDITDRKRFEETLQEKTVELERANQAKDRFLASMSHELRTPLNAIIGFTGTLLMRLPGPITEPQEQQLTTIQSSGRHLLSLINDLLDLAKVESGKLELHDEPVDLKALVDEVCGTLRPFAEKKGLLLDARSPRRPVVIETDRRALSQVLLNLSNNAIKFTETGTVRIEVRRVRGATEIRVSDTGIGIRPADIGKLFEAFEQVDGSAARRREGTGLGLHLSKKLAEALGGEIGVESAYGRGSTFTLRLRG